MRSLTSGLQSHFQSSVLTLSTLVLIVRQDNSRFAYTSAPMNITYNGDVYKSLESITATALDSSTGAGIDNLDIDGLLSSTGISQDEVRAGRFNGASVSVYMVNYTDLTSGSVIFMNGWCGDITLNDGQYTIQFVSLTQNISQQVGDITSLTCRVAHFGDFECKAQVGTHTSAVTTVTSNNVIVFSDTQVAGYYIYGKVTFTSGPNTGLSREVRDHPSVGTAVLQEPFPYTVNVGDTATLTEGCDRNFRTCKTKRAPVSDGGGAGNQLNFHAEPYLPGNDAYRQIGRGQ